MLLCTWGDNQAVSVLSSHPTIKMDIIIAAQKNIHAYRNVQNRKKVWYKEAFFQPEILAFFSANMAGVDQLYVYAV